MLPDCRLIDVFIHIPKTAGSTLRRIFARQYHQENIFLYEPDAGIGPIGTAQWWNAVTDHIDILRRTIETGPFRLITGHQWYGVHRYIERPCRYFSMVRDPLDRMISAYYYAYSYDRHVHAEKILSGDLTLEQFLSSPALQGHNDQARYLAGNGEVAAIEAADTAIALMANRYAAIGVTERFDESVLLFAKALGWKPPIYIPSNVTHLPPEVADERTRKREVANRELSNLCSADRKVYDAVSERLTTAVTEAGPAFARALDSLREIQADLSDKAGPIRYRIYEFQPDPEADELLNAYIGSAPYRAIEDYLDQVE